MSNKIFFRIDRKLKVYSSFRSNDKKAVPEIRLIGQWIEALGFEIGTPVKVTVREQLLIIEPVKDGDSRN